MRRLAGGSGWPLGYWKVDDIQQSLQELLDAGAQAQQEMKDVCGGKLIFFLDLTPAWAVLYHLVN
jgi:hypothetical protein